MQKNKILIGMIVLMLVFSIIPAFIGQLEDSREFQQRRFKENRDVIPIITKHGMKQLPLARGKPGVYVYITNPTNGDTVSGSVTITIDSNDNPDIIIDGSTVGSGLSYNWDTTTYADGSHIIEASAKGHIDTVSVTVSNGGSSNSPPTADFSYTKTDLTIDFTDQSTDSDGSISSWNWDFGDGNTSTAQNPSHTYTTDGTYTISLTVTDNEGATDSTSQSISVSSGTTGSMHVQDVYLWLDGTAGPWQHIGVQATIVDSGNNPLSGVSVDLQLETPTGSILTNTATTDSSGVASTVFSKASRTSGLFTGTVTGLIKSGYTWDTSSDVETSDTYGGGSSNSPPTADFSYTKTDLTIDFTDQSTDSDGSISSWNWDFGDGNTSTAQNPSHTYTTDGTYTISLTVTDNEGATDSTSQSISVSSGSSGINKYALVIGISDYEGWQNDLQYCDDDANDWKNFLQGQGYTVTTLIDSQATSANIEAELNNLINLEDGDDYVVLTYSGHGANDPTYGSCIISQDLYYMTHGLFEQYFSNAESQHIFVTFDACEIGDFQGLVTSYRVGAFGSNNQYSYDGTSSMQNGVFTYYQMEGWNSYDNFEQDSYYAVQEMENWASSNGVNVDPFYVDQFSGSMYP